MQFYIIDKNPQRNAKLLPDYCLKRVNIREGWQILSDIGHMYGITWEGQNKCYSTSHPTTRHHGRSDDAFDKFLRHYEACLWEYRRRFNESVFHSKWQRALKSGSINRVRHSMPHDVTDEQASVAYLLSAKRDKLTEKEIQRLETLLDS